MDNLRSELDDAEELAIKQKREINDLKNAKDASESEVARLQKAKRRMQTELDQLNAIFEQEKSEIADLESKVKRGNKVGNYTRILFFMFCQEFPCINITRVYLVIVYRSTIVLLSLQ